MTQEEWLEYMDPDPSHHKGPGLPVDFVNWNRDWAAEGYRLPAEAE
jgi:hypothetical protein